MVWFVALFVGIGVVVLCREFASGRWSFDPMSAPVRSTPDPGLPVLPGADDVDDVRFDTAARGYRMGDVDAALDHLRDRLSEQERQLAELRGEPDPTADADPGEVTDRADGDPAGAPETESEADEPAPSRRTRRARR